MATAHKSETGAVSGILRSPSLPVVLIAAAVVIGLAALLPLVQSSGATSIAGTVHLLELQKADAQARVRELEVAVARLGSLDRIEQEAKKRFQMGPPKEVHYLRVEAPAPQEHRLPSRFLPPQPHHTETGSSLWEDLFGWVPLP